ncbi:MAG: RnfABCDGE type electron transport complex subunit D [Deltaproteobacteria bacterium]|nr:RnfABCDGE type electron transport complex subunit D [Deltaproteobacteria bacterium]
MEEKIQTQTPDAGVEKKPRKAEASKSPLIKGLVVGSSPHALMQDSVPKIMHTVVLSLLPVVAVSVYFFGMRALSLIIVCTLASVITEYVFQRMRGRPVTIHDGSAIITGILLALTLPPDFPISGAVLGSVFAIGIGKQIFGGLGLNIFNPALLGRAFLQAAYPVLITTWVEPFSRGVVDAISAATPLALKKFDGIDTSHLDLFFGNIAGSLGETSALAILAGGLYLRYKGYINWRLPLGYLGSIAFFGAIFWLIDAQKYPDPLFHILSGGAMLAAWFMVTDMVTTPVTLLGQWIFVVVAGFFVVIIRLFGGLPEGVMYSILLMNAVTPLLNRWTRPKVFGAGDD